jgi:hypothetical protein
MKLIRIITQNIKIPNDKSFNNDIVKKIISHFDIISSVLLILFSGLLVYFTPFLGSLIRSIARDFGYGSAQRFYFLIENFEFYLMIVIIYLILNGILLLLGGLGIRYDGK